MVSFEEFARSYGLIVDSALPDARVHAVCTTDKPKSHKNGRYLWTGFSGWAQNWATMDKPAVFKSDAPISRRNTAAIARKVANEEREKHAAARVEAKRIISECITAPHEYLTRKGFPGLNGLVHPSGDLVIPMRDHAAYGVVNSVQRIGPDGAKKFLHGGKAKGSIFRIGDRGERWLCEGYVTGLSLHLALKDMYRTAMVTVCFSAGNLVHVAQSVKQAFVMADHDASHVGQEAAQATKFKWVMPNLEGEDCNDLMTRAGLRAVKELLRTV